MDGGILYLYVESNVIYIYQKWVFLTNNQEIERLKTFDGSGCGVKSFVN